MGLAIGISLQAKICCICRRRDVLVSVEGGRSGACLACEVGGEGYQVRRAHSVGE